MKDHMKDLFMHKEKYIFQTVQTETDSLVRLYMNNNVGPGVHEYFFSTKNNFLLTTKSTKDNMEWEKQVARLIFIAECLT